MLQAGVFLFASVWGESCASRAVARSSSRVLIIAAAVAYQITGVCDAQPFFGDLRNLDDTHVKSHFLPPAYRSLEAWVAACTRIRQQILVSAGLVPLPQRNSLNVRRTSRQQHGNF